MRLIMKIIRIEIDAFGKFNKFILNFSEGLQIIHGGNEDGKTTIMDFIKLILYSKAVNIRSIQNPRRKYIPFSGRQPAGALVIEHSGTQYAIQKAIGDTPGKDRVRILNLKTGKEEPPRNREAGHLFIGLDPEGFEQICFIENTGRINTPTGFNAEEQTIANLTGTGDKYISRQVIIKRLTDAKESLISRNGKNGSLVEIRARLQRLKIEKVQTDTAFRTQSALIAEYEALMERHAEQRKLKHAAEIIGLYENAAKVESLLNLINERSKEQAALSRPNIPSDRLSEYLERLKQASVEYFNAKNLIDEWIVEETGYDGLSVISEDDIKQYENLEQRKLELESDMKALTQMKAPASIGLPPVLHVPAMLFIAITAVTVALYLSSSYYLFILVLMPLVFIRIKTGYPKTGQNSEAIIQQIVAVQTQSEQILKKYRCQNSSELRQRYIVWKAHAKNLEVESRLEIKLNACADRFITIAELYEPVKTPNDAQMLLDRLTAAAEGMEKLNTAIREQTEGLGFATENPAEISARLADMKMKVSLAFAGQDPEKVLRRWNSVKDEDFSGQLLDLQKKIKTPKYTPDQLESEIKKVSAEAADMAVYYKALEYAIVTMEEAAGELRCGFGAELNLRAGSIFSELTKGLYNEILIDRDYSLSIKDNSIYRGHEYFSSGAIDQAYLALRLALSEMSSGSAEEYPLLLDDTLMQYDDERLQAALNRLKKRTGQTIIFTCHWHIAKAAQQLGAQIVSIRGA